jgi:hypothetical protein
MMRPLFLLATLLAGTSSTASAQDIVPAQATAELDPCQLPLPQGTAPQAQALVRSACNEHRLWHSPFIDRQGRLARLPVTEAENGMLADDGLRAWQRVAAYWLGSNTLHRTSAQQQRLRVDLLRQSGHYRRQRTVPQLCARYPLVSRLHQLVDDAGRCVRLPRLGGTS